MTEPMMITENMRNDRAEKVSKIIENINKKYKESFRTGDARMLFCLLKRQLFAGTFLRRSPRKIRELRLQDQDNWLYWRRMAAY